MSPHGMTNRMAALFGRLLHFTGGTMSTSQPLVPSAVKLAAKRGFIRTASQSIATALAGGITVALVTDAVAKAQSGDWVALAISAAVAVGTPVINGAQSYFSFIAKGLPEDYLPAALDQSETR